MNILSYNQHISLLSPANRIKTNNYSVQSPISFSGSKDMFIRKTVCEPFTEGISCIRKMKPGEFGSVCDGSLPLTSFFEAIPQSEHAKVIEQGMSTNTSGAPHCFLKSTADKPLSTSSVFNCSVMYLFNKDTNTHFIYHASPDEKKETLDFMVKHFMPEGVTHACLSPGTKNYSFTHGQVLNQMYSVIRRNNKHAVINVQHQSSTYPEVVGYKGRLFEIPNEKLDLENPRTYGQA
ncbi:MAG: hypothetical protein NC200_08155, partial [Candidatus Gastranaerophilales bacterium]|nr:hypothetical protein [Candidatus Gastranaerophilales bacterium]